MGHSNHPYIHKIEVWLANVLNFAFVELVPGSLLTKADQYTLMHVQQSKVKIY